VDIDDRHRVRLLVSVQNRCATRSDASGMARRTRSVTIGSDVRQWSIHPVGPPLKSILPIQQTFRPLRSTGTGRIPVQVCGSKRMTRRSVEESGVSLDVTPMPAVLAAGCAGASDQPGMDRRGCGSDRFDRAGPRTAAPNGRVSSLCATAFTSSRVTSSILDKVYSMVRCSP